MMRRTGTGVKNPEESTNTASRPVGRVPSHGVDDA